MNGSNEEWKRSDISFQEIKNRHVKLGVGESEVKLCSVQESGNEEMMIDKG